MVEKDIERRRIKQIREIVRGIFDKDERKAVLKLLSDYERLAGLKVRQPQNVRY